jgi:acyl-CoA reductase-like NAD-dependent aldehyde dehydrogenase
MNIIAAHSPINGELLGQYPVTPESEIRKLLVAAREAQAQWCLYSPAERAQCVAGLTKVILTDIDRIVSIISSVSGKVQADALLGEIYPILETLKYYQRHAGSILATRGVVTSPFSFPNASAKIAHSPFGIIAVIAPWNFPFQLSLMPMITALIAGNAVILKPSELSFPVAELIGELLYQAGIPRALTPIIYGDKTSAEQLIDAKPDLVFFTGSVPAGRKVMARAAQHPIPVILELGGKDPLMVFSDAPFDRAVRAAVYGAFCNSGQVCVSVERCYVQRDIYQAFVDAAVAATASLRVGHAPQGDMGAMVSERQIDIIEAHYQDAKARGAQASGPLRREGNYLHPVVLWNVNHEMLVMREESFGPLLPIMAFDDEAEAVRLANDSPFGLNASIFSLDLVKAERVAAQLQVGNWAINDVIKNIGHPGLSFGGLNQSGFGRYHGAEGLLSFSQTVSSLSNRGITQNEPNWFPYSEDRYLAFKGYMDFIFGDGPLWRRGKRNSRALLAFKEYSSLNLRQHFENIKLSLPWNRG